MTDNNPAQHHPARAFAPGSNQTDEWRLAARGAVQDNRHVEPADPDAQPTCPAYIPSDRHLISQRESAQWLMEYLVLADELTTQDEALGCLTAFEEELTDLAKLAGAIQLGASLLRLMRRKIAAHITTGQPQQTSTWLHSLMIARAATDTPETPARPYDDAHSPVRLWHAASDLLRYSFNDSTMVMTPVTDETVLRLAGLFVAVARDDRLAVHSLIDETLVMTNVGSVVLACLNRLAWGAGHLFEGTGETSIAQVIHELHHDTDAYLDITWTLAQDKPAFDPAALLE